MLLVNPKCSLKQPEWSCISHCQFCDNFFAAPQLLVTCYKQQQQLLLLQRLLMLLLRRDHWSQLTCRWHIPVGWLPHQQSSTAALWLCWTSSRQLSAADTQRHSSPTVHQPALTNTQYSDVGSPDSAATTSFRHCTALGHMLLDTYCGQWLACDRRRVSELICVQLSLIFNADHSRGGRVLTGICVFVCLSAWYLKNWCSQDHQAWHTNALPWVLGTHLFGSPKLRGQGHKAQKSASVSFCTLVSAVFL